MKMTMKSLKTKKMKEKPEAGTRRRSVEVKKRLLIQVKMRQLQSKHLGRRKRVDVMPLKMKLRLKTPTEVTTTAVKVRIKEVVIEVVIVTATATETETETVIVAKAAMLAKIRSAEAETRRKEMVIGRRNVEVGMRMMAGTVMQRSVVVSATMVMTKNPLRNEEEGRIEIVVTAIVVTVIVATVIVATVIEVIVIVVIVVIVIGIGIEVRVKRRGDENEAKQAKKSDLQMRCIYMLPLKVAKDCNTSHQEIFVLSPFYSITISNSKIHTMGFWGIWVLGGN